TDQRRPVCPRGLSRPDSKVGQAYAATYGPRLGERERLSFVPVATGTLNASMEGSGPQLARAPLSRTNHDNGSRLVGMGAVCRSRSLGVGPQGNRTCAPG